MTFNSIYPHSQVVQITISVKGMKLTFNSVKKRAITQF